MNTARLGRPACAATIEPESFTMTSTATADMPLRQGWLRLKDSQSGRLAAHPLDILLQVGLGLSRLRAPVSHGISAISRRTVMNHAGEVTDESRVELLER